MPVLMGVFDQADPICDVARSIRDRGLATDMEAYAPAAFSELENAIDEKPSRVRIFTLIGGLAVVLTAHALPLLMVYGWPITVVGKPFPSFPPDTLIAFVPTIHFGRLLTALGPFPVARPRP